MASTINSDNGVVSGSSGLKSTADTSGVLALQSNGTTGLTLNTSLALGVGSGNSTGSSGQVLTSAGSGAAPTWATPTVTSPAGSNTQIQYNNSGSFGASSSLTFDGNQLTLTSSTTAANIVANSSLNTPYITFQQSNASKFYIGESSAVGGGGAGFYDLYAVAGLGLRFFTAAAERLRIGTAGQFGIGGANYGTSGQVLTSGGSGAAPTWASPAGGGSMIFLSTVTASGATTVDIETTFDSTYDQYVIYAPAFTLSGNPTNGELKMRLKIGGSYPASTGYMYASDQTNSTTYSGLSSSNNDAIYLSNRLSDSPSFPNAVMDLVIYVSKPSTTNRYKTVMWQGNQTFGNNPNVMNGVGWYSGSTAALTGVRLLFSGGATFSGSFRLYGIKNS